jgi:tRNA pseudouridine38-40 synthase
VLGVRITLAYDGTRFAGFQRQRPPPGQSEVCTVQGVLEAAIARITDTPVVVRGASRTDSGVHAEGQVVAFDSERELPPRRWLLAINRYLPDDVAVQAVEECAPGYAPRFDAVDKTYRYLYHLGLARDPLLMHRAWQLARSGPPPDDGAATPHARSGPLDLAAMRAAAAQLLGTHDFRAFRAADDERHNTVRTLHRVELLENFHDRKNLLALEVRGSAFMKNMVRIIAGTLIAVGRERLTAADVPALLGEHAVRTRPMETAPAHGLTLLRVTLGRSPAPACR